ETAEIAVQASLTGHLVLSTLHTNTAVGAVARLRDMGVEPFLLASSLLGVMAQRLVRVLCKDCRQPARPHESESRILGVAAGGGTKIYHALGCPACNSSGYRGRSGIYELIPVDEHLQAMIHQGESEQALERYSRTLSPGIRDDGIRKVLDGTTTLEEVVRVTRDD